MSNPNSTQLSGKTKVEVDPALPTAPPFASAPPAPAGYDAAPAAPPLAAVAAPGLDPQPSNAKGNTNAGMEHHFPDNAASPAALLW
jgi:hypothetical protein